MLTVCAESALLLMSDSQRLDILMIYQRELVIHNNLVMICECQDIDAVEVVQRRSVSGVRLYMWTYYTNLHVQMHELWFMTQMFKFLDEITTSLLMRSANCTHNVYLLNEIHP